jgi:transposase-like protein
MFALRGMVFSHEAVRAWEAKLTPALAEELRRRRLGQPRARRVRKLTDKVPILC